jgi:hypothetical protein
MREHRKLGEILVGLKVLKANDVERVLEVLRRQSRRQRFGQTARAMGLIDEEHILAALAVQMDLFPGIHRLDLRQLLQALQNPEIAAI